MPAMEPTGEQQGGANPREVQVEHEPTIYYIPPEEVEHVHDPSDHLQGAFAWALVIDKGPRAGMAFVLAEGRTTVGRDPASSMFLDDITVSRDHCVFTLEGEVLVVEDAGSTNGTYVNGERTDRAVLQSSDEVIIGRYHLIVVRGDG